MTNNLHVGIFADVGQGNLGDIPGGQRIAGERGEYVAVIADDGNVEVGCSRSGHGELVDVTDCRMSIKMKRKMFVCQRTTILTDAQSDKEALYIYIYIYASTQFLLRSS